MTEYRLHVEGVLKEGHPIQVISQNLRHISIEFDLYCTKYPHNKITLVELREVLIKENVPLERPLPTKCPRGHEGLVDKKSVIVETAKGYFCKICGAIWEAEAT